MLEEEFGRDDSNLFYLGIFLFLLVCVVVGALYLYSRHLKLN